MGGGPTVRGFGAIMNSLPPGTYYVIATGIHNGARYGIQPYVF